MLQPDERTLLVDALRPPAGMQLDYAVGTTFSLDIEAMLIAPVTFALFDARVAEGRTGTDPLSIIEAVRRHAANIDLFCQAGQIHVPREYQPITAYMERSVHACTTGRPHRIFHPKVWVLRFRSGDDLAYRLLVMSRNLTASRSWDTIVRMEGVPGEPDTRNDPLVSFLTALPSLRVGTGDELDRVDTLAGEVRSVRWTLPEGFDDFEFLFFPDAREKPAFSVAYDRILVMSPFASTRRLAALTTPGNDVLISRAATLNEVGADALDAYDAVYVLSPAAADHELEEDPVTFEELAERPDHYPTGLHAKVYVGERGNRATVVTGSPNATDAAFEGNVEFAVALSGPRRTVGIDRMLSGDEPDPLIGMLEPYYRNDDATDPDPLSVAARVLEELGRIIATIEFVVSIEEQDGDVFRLQVHADRPLPDLGDAAVSLWPISRPPSAVPLVSGGVVDATFTGLSIQAVTSFFCLELTVVIDGEDVVSRVVVNARLVGDPADRYQRILMSSLQSKGDVLRYLLFLLADQGDPDAAAGVSALLASDGAGGDAAAGEIPLFESMVRALDRSPESLDHIDRLITDLRATPEGRLLLPDGLDDVWPSIREARKELGS